MADNIISVENLCKMYQINHQAERRGSKTFRETVTRKASQLFGGNSRNGTGRKSAGDPSINNREEFWALRDVSFEVKQGDVLGIIGRNGAGKSTLLKILSRITEPTEGRVRIAGRVASLLEVGTGFHPELTGRENIFLNGAILGMSKAEIKRKFDEIVDFAGTERFLDTPVKRYSSGMYVRLAFAVAAHLEPEILIVDEVLAVGDTEFQKKCLGKMKDVSGHGRTVLFVSHNMAAAKALCSRAVLLESGRLIVEGPIGEIVDRYLERSANTSGTDWERPQDLATSEIYFTRASVRLSGRQPDLHLEASIELRCLSAQNSLICLDILDAYGTPIMQVNPSATPLVGDRTGIYSVDIDVDLPPLIPGRYSMDLWVGPHYTVTSDYPKGVLAFEITDGPILGRSMPYNPSHGFLIPKSSYRCVAALAGGL